jgi:hypothetical protein
MGFFADHSLCLLDIDSAAAVFSLSLVYAAEAEQ